MSRLVRTHRRRALALVEAALALPLLMLVTLALMEYGWMYLTNEQVTHAARGGARTACRAGAGNANVFSEVDRILTVSGIPLAARTTTLSPANIGTMTKGTPLTVTVQVNYSLIKLIGGPFPLPANLWGRESMLKEGP